MFFWTVRFLILVAAKFVYRFNVSGAHNVPREGAFILCGNHIHSYDPAMLAINIPRQMRIMAKKELFQTKAKNWFFRNMGAFPVDRGVADMTSYRIAMKALAEGRGLLIFSQGTRMKELNLEGIKGGVALFGVKSRAPIIPVGISGSYRFRSKLEIHFGEPITLDEYYDKRIKTEQIEEIMAKIMSEVERLVV